MTYEIQTLDYGKYVVEADKVEWGETFLRFTNTKDEIVAVFSLKHVVAFGRVLEKAKTKTTVA